MAKWTSPAPDFFGGVIKGLIEVAAAVKNAK
jgi:hypothetical protein